MGTFLPFVLFYFIFIFMGQDAPPLHPSCRIEHSLPKKHMDVRAQAMANPLHYQCMSYEIQVV